MARAQNSAKGLLAKDRIDIGANQITKNSTAILLSGGIRLSGQANALLTGNSTGVVANAAIKISNAQGIAANTTGLVFANAAMSALPGSVRQASAAIGFVVNSTGRCLAINTTGTTWLFLAVTSVQPTT